MFRIYYEDGSVVEGVSKSDWRKSRKDGVQVVVSFPRTQPVRWHYKDNDGENVAVTDRDLWTGTDAYDPFGYGAKIGSLISDSAYEEIWRRACIASSTT